MTVVWSGTLGLTNASRHIGQIYDQQWAKWQLWFKIMHLFERTKEHSHLFYHLSITIWRTIAQLGTSPAVAHCIQAIMLFFIEFSDTWIYLPSSHHISTCFAQAPQTASAPGAQIKDFCFPPSAKRPRRSSHRQACFSTNTAGTWNMHTPDLSPNYLIYRIRVCVHSSCCNPVRASPNTKVSVGRAIAINPRLWPGSRT